MQDNIDNKIKKIIDKYPDLWNKQLYRKGKIVHYKGDAIIHNYYIESGIVKFYVCNEQTGVETIIDFWAEGNSILFLEIFTHLATIMMR